MEDNEYGWSAAEVVELLERVDLFGGLPVEDLRRFAGIVGGRTAEEGQTLFEVGAPVDALYIVYDGAVEIVRARPDGTEEKLGVRRAGDVFGESGFLTGQARPATARAAETTQLLVVDRSDFRDLLGGDSLAVRMVEALSKRPGAGDVAAGGEGELREGRTHRPGHAHDISRVLQAGLLPSSAPRVEGFDVAAGTTTEATGRGSSVWDWIGLKDGRVALLTLDVRQDGFPPAHYLGMARAVLRGVAGDAATVSELLARTNDALSAAAVEGVDQFVEVGILVPAEGGLEWASAGRVPGGVIRRAGTFEELGSHGPPLGMMGGFKYHVQKLSLGSGDTTFVLSHASQGLFLGAADLMAQLHGKPAGEVVATLHKAIRKAQGQERTETSVLYLRRH
ncbi:MAG: cyclic nucleotide-binding domain-containing protein [Gemmatimonadota bacterium]